MCTGVPICMVHSFDFACYWAGSLGDVLSPQLLRVHRYKDFISMSLYLCKGQSNNLRKSWTLNKTGSCKKMFLLRKKIFIKPLGTYNSRQSADENASDFFT